MGVRCTAEHDPWLQDIDLILPAMANVDGDQDRRRVVVITLMQGYIHCAHESFRPYATRSKANWRDACWNQQNHEEVLYKTAWGALRNSHENKVGPKMPAGARLDMFDDSFDKAATSEVIHVEHKMPH
jgi:hypothetical protein